MKFSNLFIVSVVFILWGIGRSASAQTVYTWTAGTSGTWSTPANWTGTGSSFPGNSEAGDTATINSASTNQTITYSTANTFSLGTLNLTESTASVTNILLLNQSMTVTNALTLGATAGTAEIEVQATSTKTNPAFTDLAGITVNTGGELDFDTSNQAGPTPTISVGSTGTLLIAGGSLVTNANTGFGDNATITGNLSMSAGAINLLGTGHSSVDYIKVSGNLNTTGGTITSNSTLVSGSGYPNAIFVNGGTANISNTTLSSNLVFALAGAQASQSFTIDNGFGSTDLLSFQPFYTGGVSTLTLSVTNSSATVGTIDLVQTQNNANDGVSLTLGSNVTVASGATLINATSTVLNNNGTQAGATGLVYGLNTNGHTLDLTQGQVSGVGGTGAIWTPVSGTTNAAYWNLTGSGSILATAFNLNSSTIASNVGAGLTLQATGTGANNLGNVTPASLTAGTISPTSTFLYTGTSATLATNRNLGALTVGNGSAGSTLQILTSNGPVTTAGSTKIAASSILDLNGNNLVVGVSGSGVAAPLLTGTGTIKNSTATATTISFGSSASAGLNVTNGVSTTGTLNINSTNGVALNLTNAALTFNLTSGNASDQVAFSTSAGSLTFSSNTINFNDLTSGHTLSSGLYTLFNVTGGSASNYSGLTLGAADGNGGNIISSGLVIGSGLSAYSGNTLQLQLNNSSGLEEIQLDIIAVPEPSTWAMMLGGLVLLVGCLRRRFTMSV